MIANPPLSERFVGLDLSLNGTGVAILRRSQGVWMPPEHYTLRMKPPSPVTKTYETERLCRIISRLRELQVFDADVKLAALEDYAYGIPKDKTSCVFQLGELGGLVRYHLYSSGVWFIPCPISVNKKFATGFGAAEKKDVADAMSALWGIPKFGAKELDQSDALSLASVAAYKFYGGLPDLQTYKFQARLVQPLEVVCREE